jgi:phosphatidylglycerophosphate synthase
MIDSFLRPHVLPFMDSIAAKTVQGGLSANKLTLIAYMIGMIGCFAVAMQAYPFGLVLLLLNRFIDGLAESAARQNGITEFGTILDTLCDYLVFAGFAFFFSLSAMETILASAFLILSYLAMGMAYMAHAWVLAKKNIPDMPHGGIVGNSEMIIFISLCCLYPPLYAGFAAVFALLCWTTAALRFLAAVKTIRS